MKRILIGVLVFALILSLPAAAIADNGAEMTPEQYYTVGSDEHTFEGLHDIMCVNLNLREYPVPEPEYIGYVYDYKHEPKFIVRYWIGYHEEGELIGMLVYYMTDGKYLGNIRWDYTNELANSSSRVPYNVPGKGMHKLR